MSTPTRAGMTGLSMISDQHRAWAEGLTREERVLVVVRDELCGGSWDELVRDLQARQSRKPHVFKLNTRIDEDLDRIAKLRSWEEEQGLDLRSLLESVSPTDSEEGNPQ